MVRNKVMIITDETLNTITVIVNGVTKLHLVGITELTVHHLSPEQERAKALINSEIDDALHNEI